MSHTNKETVLNYRNALLIKEPATISLSGWLITLESRYEANWNEALWAEISNRGSGYEAGQAVIFYRFFRYFHIGIEKSDFERMLSAALEEELEATDKEVGTFWHLGKAMALCDIQHELEGVVGF